MLYANIVSLHSLMYEIYLIWYIELNGDLIDTSLLIRSVQMSKLYNNVPTN